MSKFFEYFVLSMFYVTSGFLVLLVWDLDNVAILPAIVVNGIVLISLLLAYMETKADEGE